MIVLSVILLLILWFSLGFLIFHHIDGESLVTPEFLVRFILAGLFVFLTGTAIYLCGKDHGKMESMVGRP